MSPGVANAAKVKCEDPFGVVLLGNYSAKKLPNGQYRIVTSPVKGNPYPASIMDWSIEGTTVVDFDFETDGSGNIVRSVVTYANGGRLVHSMPTLKGYLRSTYTGPKPKALTVRLEAPDTTDDSSYLWCNARVVVK